MCFPLHVASNRGFKPCAMLMAPACAHFALFAKRKSGGSPVVVGIDSRYVWLVSVWLIGTVGIAGNTRDTTFRPACLRPWRSETCCTLGVAPKRRYVIAVTAEGTQTDGRRICDLLCVLRVAALSILFQPLGFVHLSSLGKSATSLFERSITGATAKYSQCCSLR